MKIARVFPNKKFRIGEIPVEDRKYLNSVIASGMTWIEDKKYYEVTDVFTHSREEDKPCECNYIIILKILIKGKEKDEREG